MSFLTPAIILWETRLIAWTVAHVWDRFDYGRDKNWYASVGYPLMKGVASFWIDLLVQDDYFKDGTLVANPCNSPEHGPTVGSITSCLFFIWSGTNKRYRLLDVRSSNK